MAQLRYVPDSDSCSAANWALLNDLISASEHDGRYIEADCLVSLSIDHQLELGWLFHRQIAGFGALEDLVHHASRTTVEIGIAHPVAHQAPGLDEFS